MLGWGLRVAAAVWLAMPATASAETGLLRSVWGCFVPCVAKESKDLLGYLQVSYCATSALGLEMLRTLDPLCREKTKRPDAVAARTSATDVATCNSSSNPCPQEGLTRAGFSCQFVCPSQDNIIRKFTACAKTGDEAWSHVTGICKDAVPPSSSFHARAFSCTAEGQTPCE